jgi:hypothetical protein
MFTHRSLKRQFNAQPGKISLISDKSPSRSLVNNVLRMVTFVYYSRPAFRPLTTEGGVCSYSYLHG